MSPQRRRLMADGLAAGLLGYGLVVAFFVVVNLLGGDSAFYTAALMGEALFEGLRDPTAVTMAAGPVIAFNGVHLTAYLLFGYFAAWLVYETELHPEFWYLAFFMFVGASVISYAAVLAVMALLGNPVPTWTIVSASLLAALGMAGYLTVAHRSMIQAIDAAGEPRLGRVE